MSTITEVLFNDNRISSIANLETSGYSIPVRIDSISEDPFTLAKITLHAISQITRRPNMTRAKPVKVIFNPPATIVFWEDGTKTVVKCSANDEFDPTMGLAMAMCKKMYGNTGSYNDIFRRFIPDSTTHKSVFQTNHAESKIGNKICFELEDCGSITATVQKITDTEIIYMTDDCVMESKMNANDTNAGGYDDSWLRVKLEDLKMRFPADLRDKITSIAPPTYGQIFGHDEWYERVLKSDDDEQFELMKIRKNRVADYKNDYAWYWLKNSTKKSVSASNFAAVYGDGGCGYDGASYSHGVRVVFHVKK